MRLRIYSRVRWVLTHLLRLSNSLHLTRPYCWMSAFQSSPEFLPTWWVQKASHCMLRYHIIIPLVAGLVGGASYVTLALAYFSTLPGSYGKESRLSSIPITVLLSSSVVSFGPRSSLTFRTSEISSPRNIAGIIQNA